jgi:hypothetical protein
MSWKSGDVIVLFSHETASFRLRFIIDEKQKSVFTLAAPEHPYRRVRMKQTGEVDFFTQVGKNSLFSIELDGSCICLKSTVKIGDSVAYLGMDKDGQLIGSPRLSDSVITKFAVVMGDEQIPRSPTESAILDGWELRRFMTDGFIQLCGMTDMDAVFNCQQLFMRCLGIPGAIAPGGAQVGYGKLAGSFSNCSEVRALLGTGRVMRVVEELFGGRGTVDGLHELSAQIAMRFPELAPRGQSITTRTHKKSGGEYLPHILLVMRS